MKVKRRNIILIGLILSAILGIVYLKPDNTPLAKRIVYAEDGMIEEGYVTYATAKYFPLVEVLLDSVEIFSTRPIVVFGINADVPFSQKKYPFMVKKRIDIDSSSKESVFFTKPRVLLESQIRNGIYVDSDIVLNDGCDVLFDHCKKISQFPLCPIFPWEVNNQQPVMEAMGIPNKTMPYVHAPLIIYSDKSTAFIEEWRQSNIEYGHLAACHDETMLNVLLWKHGATDSYINLCDPYFALAYDYIKDYIEGPGSRQHLLHGYRNWVGKIDFYAFHGCKNAKEAKGILLLLAKKKEAQK